MPRKRTRIVKDSPKREVFALTDRDRKAFFDALVNPHKPNARLERALANHRRRVATDVERGELSL
jgi:uncharacterized protein (DUF1778 family)